MSHTSRVSRVRHAAGVSFGVALLSTAACTDGHIPTTPAGPLDSPVLATAASSGGGAVVDRSLFPYGFLGGGDPRDGLAFFAGPVDPVAAVPIKCADPSIIVPISPGARTQTVTTPSGRIQTNASNDATHIAVWQYGEGIVTDACQLLGAPLVATGVVHYTAHTTNQGLLFGDEAGPGATTWHVNAEGIVELTSGGQARLHVTVRILILPDGTFKFDEERVRLTPL